MSVRAGSTFLKLPLVVGRTTTRSSNSVRTWHRSSRDLRRTIRDLDNRGRVPGRRKTHKPTMMAPPRAGTINKVGLPLDTRLP